jgi:hypothetical protein
MNENDKMMCPVCKLAMNFHAIKVDYSGSQSTSETAETGETSETYGGILEEFHSCPGCGMTAERELAPAQ